MAVPVLLGSAIVRSIPLSVYLDLDPRLRAKFGWHKVLQESIII